VEEVELGFRCLLDERLVRDETDPTDITDAILGCDIKFEKNFGEVEEVNKEMLPRILRLVLV
jgi:hypothetical protein